MSAILAASEVVVQFNDRLVLDRASLTVNDRDRIGMVGRNGSGKSTLLKILAGLHKPDSGVISPRRLLTIGYLPQAFELDPDRTVTESVRSGADHVLGLIAEFESLPPVSHRHAELEERILALDGWGLDHRIEAAMAHLNCPAPDRQIGNLSGGEQRRVALCRALISRPEVLMLDEPTNHLDTESIEWLAEFLETYPGALLVVTHDRYFLDRVSNRIAEVSQGSIFCYTGNYTDYLITRAEREAAQEVNEHKRQMFLKRELEWVRRGPKARATKSKSRLDRYYEVAGESAPELAADVDMVIPPPPPLGNRIVELENVGMAIQDRQLFSGLNLEFTPGQRVGISGRNGLGKTTLLKIMLGEIPPTEGTVKLGQLTQFNYVDQGRLQLNEERTVLEEISEGSDFVLFGDQQLSMRAYLKRFLFSDERLGSQVKYLSGGERSRLLLARILKNGGNFLILDEPTNDLDLPTLRVLEEALLAFPGVVVVVSHDRYFLNRVCTDILAFEDTGTISHSVGNYDYYVEKRSRALDAASTAIAPPGSQKPGPSNAQRTQGKPRKLTFKENRELEGMEAAILEIEEDIARIEALFGEPDFHRKHGDRTASLTEELAAGKERLATLYKRWEELETISSTAQQARQT